MTPYSFTVEHDGRGGSIRCKNDIWDIKYDIELMAVGPTFVIYVEKRRLPDAQLILQLDKFLKETDRDWEIMLVGNTSVS
jgi:hypothetical protein